MKIERIEDDEQRPFARITLTRAEVGILGVFLKDYAIGHSVLGTQIFEELKALEQKERAL